MKSNNNISSDLEDGKGVGETALQSTLQRRNPLDLGRFVAMVMVVPKFKKLIKMGHKSAFLRIFHCFNVTETKMQQKVLLLLCVAAVILDPLFFYIPMINEGSKCMKSDRKLGVIAMSLRSLVDVLHFVLWWCYYEKKWKEESSKSGATANKGSLPSSAEGKENPTGNSNSFSPRNSRVTGLSIEILCILPLPQAETLAILFIKGNPSSQLVVTLLKFSVLSQSILRAFRVFPSFHEAMTNSVHLLNGRFWIGAGFNLLLFVISSHVLGAFWYLLSVGRMMDCWKSACRSRVGCNIDSLYCGGPMDNKSYLDNYCPIQQATNSSAFDFGIYLSALESNVVASTRFTLKLSYCFWWGLRNLSSLGQNLTTSAYEWEILFSICISILGLILFSLLIGNMQVYLQYTTNEDLKNMNDKNEKLKKKQMELSNWRPLRWLPQNLRKKVMSCLEDNWLKTPVVDLRSTLDNLPKDLGRKIKKIILSKLQKNVECFRELNSTIDHVKPEVFDGGSLMFKKDDPIDKMVFILNGKLTEQSGANGSRDRLLKAWDFCGEELLSAIKSCSPLPLPSDDRPRWKADIKACTKVEAFILDASDLQALVKVSKDTKATGQSIEKPREKRNCLKRCFN